MDQKTCLAKSWNNLNKNHKLSLAKLEKTLMNTSEQWKNRKHIQTVLSQIWYSSLKTKNKVTYKNE